MIVADVPVATEYASATTMDKATERQAMTVRYPTSLTQPR
jgi:hypothetical protein